MHFLPKNKAQLQPSVSKIEHILHYYAFGSPMPGRQGILRCTSDTIEVFDSTSTPLFTYDFSGGNTHFSPNSSGASVANPTGDELEVSAAWPDVPSAYHLTAGFVYGKSYTYSFDITNIAIVSGLETVECTIFLPGGGSIVNYYPANSFQSVTFCSNGTGGASIQFKYIEDPMSSYTGLTTYFGIDNLSFIEHTPNPDEISTTCVLDKNGYRYGFNGMEKDNEINGEGNIYTTDYRELDTRIGRWFSIDPLFYKFPSQSPYVTFDNKPILIKDPKGLEGKKSNDDSKRQKKEDKRYANLKSRMEKRFGKETDKYYFELYRRASKPRYGSRTETGGSLFGQKKGPEDKVTGNTFQVGYDNRKSETQSTEIWGVDGNPKKAPMGVAGTSGGPDQTITLENVTDGDVIYLEANTWAGFRTEVYIDGVLQVAFADSYQAPLPPGATSETAAGDHGRQIEVKSLAINTGSTTPKTITITFKAVYTEVGATVHRTQYHYTSPLSKITVARPLKAATGPIIK